MRIIKGRGNNRKIVVDFPCADIVNQSPQEEQVAAQKMLCERLNIPYSTVANA